MELQLDFSVVLGSVMEIVGKHRGIYTNVHLERDHEDQPDTMHPK